MDILTRSRSGFKLTAIAALVSLLTACGGGSEETVAPPPPPPPPQNQPPEITSTPQTSATEDVAYSYQVSANDPDASTAELVYSLENAPEGMTISSSGLITWTPVEGQLTSEEVLIVVAESDASDALSAEQSLTVTVTPVNDQLSVSQPAEAFSLDNGATFSQQIEVSDVDDENNGTDISFSLSGAPSGMTVSATGLIEWTPAIGQSTEFDVVVNVADGGEDGTTPVAYNFNLDVLVYAQVSGQVVNYYSGDGLADVELVISNGTDSREPILSDGQGEFTMSVVDRFLTDRVTILANAEGYANYATTFSSESELGSQFLALLPSDVTSTFDPTAEHTVSFSGIDLLDIPANSLVREDGMAIDGDVSAQVTIIDPSSDIDVMPGDMLTLEDGELFPIESFGAMDVILTDQSGAAVNVAEGQSVTVRIPLGSASETPPATIPLYYYDPVAGAWIEEGTAALTTADGETFYQGTVEHFTTWNADQRYNTVFINGCVVDIDDNPINRALVKATGRDYSGSSSARTDAEGLFSIPVMRGGSVLLSSSDGNQSRTLTVNVGDEDYTIDECLELSQATATVSLTWGLSPRDLDTHFFGPSDDQGNEFHIFYVNQEETVNESTMYLDVDDTSSYGPEILTIPEFALPGRYQYVVHQYSSSGESILTSPTRIEVILDGRMRIIAPQDGEVTRYWHVFDFVVDDQGGITIEEVNQWIDGTNDRVALQRPVSPQSQMKAPTLKQRNVEQKYYSDRH